MPTSAAEMIMLTQLLKQMLLYPLGKEEIMHIQKYNKASVCHMFDHYDRNSPGKKSNIDADKTYQNYNLAAEDQPLPQFDFLLQRISEVKVQKRKDVIVMCDWAIIAPKTLAEHEYATFFLETYKFMSGRYGKENVISAYVHMDETQQHMHFSFIPITKDKKKDRYKVCAKEVITKRELQTIHKDMNSYITEVFGRDIGILNGATALGNVTVDTLRKNKAKVAKVQDAVITKKAAELERVRNSAAGKIFKKDTVTISGEELEHIQVVMQESTAIVDNANTILQQAEDQRYKAQHERVIAEEIRLRTEEYAREEQKKAEDKAKELDERSHTLDDREYNLQQLERETSRKYDEQIELNERYGKLTKEKNATDRELLQYKHDNRQMDKQLLQKEQENEKLRKDAERKQKLPDDTHKADMEKIRTLEKNVADHKNTIAEKDRELNEKEETISFWRNLYYTAIEVGKHICDWFRLHINFEKCVDMRAEGYRLNYIFGDDERTR